MFLGGFGIMVADISAASKHSIVLGQWQLERKKCLEIMDGDNISRMAGGRLRVS
jgi:hypothetical protein